MTNQLTVECPHCGHHVDPNDEDVPKAPPTASPHPHSLFSIICPNCDQKSDFVEWKTITDKQPSQ